VRRYPSAVFISFVLLFFQAGFAQQTPPPSAVGLLQAALAALTGGQSISDVTLSGNAHRIAGSDDESGTATLKALATGAARSDLSLSSGVRKEVCDLTAAPPAGAWSGPDGNTHSAAYHNLVSEPAWFFPAIAIAHRLTDPTYRATYIGHETHNGQAVEHVSVSQAPPSPDLAGPPTFEHLTQLDFFLDSATLLPAAISFNIHPDNNSLLDIPVEIRFSDYRSASGLQVPFHIQKFLNNSLILDLQIQKFTLNSAIPASTFDSL